MKEIHCESGGAGRNAEGYLDLYCKFCKRIMEDCDENTRICKGKCENNCDYVYPYGFVPEAGCEIHDKPSVAGEENKEIK